MIAFLTSRLGIACIAAVVAVGAFWWVYEEGKDAGEIEAIKLGIEETEDARKTREAAERRARTTPYGELLDSLFGKPPAR